MNDQQLIQSRECPKCRELAHQLEAMESLKSSLQESLEMCEKASRWVPRATPLPVWIAQKMEELDAANKENERLHALLEPLKRESPATVLLECRNALSRAAKAESARREMRLILCELKPHCTCGNPSVAHSEHCQITAYNHALSSDCGKGYVSVEQVKPLVEALEKCWFELNEIHARDGVPYTHYGVKSSVVPEYFSTVVDMAAKALAATKDLSP